MDDSVAVRFGYSMSFGPTRGELVGARHLRVYAQRVTLNAMFEVALAAAWAFICTYGVLWAIDLVTPVKVDARVEEAGLDAELHGEEAYPA